MADRRMISKSIIRQEKFLDLSLAAQALYMHLLAEADDDGFVGSAKSITRMLGTKSGDLKMLIETGFVILLDTGVAYIKHWRMHNNIRKDRYKPTIFNLEKKLLGSDFISQNDNQDGNQSGNQNDKFDNQNDNQNGNSDNQNDNQVTTQYSIDKNRIEKRREDEIKKDNLREEKNSNAITEYDIDNTEKERISSLSSITPPEEEEPIEEVGDITLPEPLGGEAQAVTPTLSEIKVFIAKNGFFLVDAKAFYDYYTKVGWDKAKNWKEKVLRWHFSNNPRWNKI